MSVFISAHNSASPRNDDQDIEAQQRRRERELRMRKRADHLALEKYLEEHAQEAPAHLYEGGREAPRSMLHALLHDELDRPAEHTPQADEEAASVAQQSPRNNPASRADTRVFRPPRQQAQEGTIAPMSRAPALGSASIGASAATPGNVVNQDAAALKAWDSKPMEDESAPDDAAQAAMFVDRLERLLDDVQLRAAEGEATVDRLLGMFNDIRRVSSWLKSEKIDVATATRIDGAYRFLSAYVDSMECPESERAGLLRKLAEGHPLKQVQQGASSQASAIDNADVGISPEAQAVKDRQTLYSYLELLKALAQPPHGGADVRNLAARVAAMQAANPSAALKRLADSGDHSASLYIGEISQRLQKVDSRDHKTCASVLRGPPGEWLENERKGMIAVMKHADEINAYASLKRSRDEARELELRAETMPLVVLQKT